MNEIGLTLPVCVTSFLEESSLNDWILRSCMHGVELSSRRKGCLVAFELPKENICTNKNMGRNCLLIPQYTSNENVPLPISATSLSQGSPGCQSQSESRLFLFISLQASDQIRCACGMYPQVVRRNARHRRGLDGDD